MVNDGDEEEEEEEEEECTYLLYLAKVQSIVLEAKLQNASCKLHVQGLGGK